MTLRERLARLPMADAVLAEIAAAGMVLVPREPTEAMLTEGHYETGEDRDTYYRIYRAMLSVAPAAD